MRKLYLLTILALSGLHALASSGDKAFDWGNATVYFVITDRFCNGDSTNDVN